MDRCRKPKRQIARQTAGAKGRMMEMRKKKRDWKREVMERLQWAGYHLALTPPLFLLLENWSVNRLESSKNPTSTVTAMVLWSSGSEKDGLVHFYCLANAPNSPVCSSIIHSILLFPSKLPSRPLSSPSKSSLSLSHSSFVLSVLHCQSSEPRSTSWDTLKMNGHGASHRILS